MYSRRHWDVLLVDDEPDVLAISRLALKNVKVYGIPLKLHECSSKREAAEYLKNTGALPDLALALVDVVMETDHAGLDLVQHIREQHGNYLTQVVLRTGQAGKAPERAVTDRLDITGYITKAEATEDRLYTLVKAAVRAFIWARVTECHFRWATTLLSESHRGRPLVDILRKMTVLPVERTSGSGYLEALQGHCAFFVDDQFGGTGKLEGAAEARAKRDALRGQPAVFTTPEGDTLHLSGKDALLELVKEDGSPAVGYVAEHTFDPIPRFMTDAFIQNMRSIRLLANAGHR